VVNHGVGDVADIVAQNHVGVTLTGVDAPSVSDAIENLNSLCLDKEVHRRCRHTAERIFSLELGVEAYRKIYAKVLG
jgi:glycosyltransferase involved in cell wall biosynthesis